MCDVGGLVKETILLNRAYKCDHEWVNLNDNEDQCCNCTVIATEEGKKRLEQIKKQYYY